MTFQSHTTYEQSVKLVELGMPPNMTDRAKPECLLSRQEIEDYLMERYKVSILFFDSHVFVKLNSWDTPDVATPFSDAPRFECEGRDPFPALYDALCWALEQERNEPKE